MNGSMIFSLAVFILLTQNCAIGWVALIQFDPATVIPEEAHCYTDFKKVGALKRNEERRLADECAVAKCQDNRDIAVNGCSPVFIKPPCYIYPGNLLKPFPECCYEVKCFEVEQNRIDYDI